MEDHVAANTSIDWTKLNILTYQPLFEVDAYHDAITKKVIPFSYDHLTGMPHATTVPTIETDLDARLSLLEAWLHCRHRHLFTLYSHETMWAAMAPYVFRLSRGVDAFQKGMMAVWENLATWPDKYPVKHNVDATFDEFAPLDSALDDVIKYLCGVARNAMRGRRRKPTLFDDSLVESAKDIRNGLDPDAVISKLPISGIEKKILRLKSRRVSETEIGQQVGLSRDQVSRRITKLYHKMCAEHALPIKHMGRVSRQTG